MLLSNYTYNAQQVYLLLIAFAIIALIFTVTLVLIWGIVILVICGLST